MSSYEFHRGTLPLLISIPHAGTDVPEAIFKRLAPAARALPDTDWYVHELYAFARDLGASIVKGNCSRYVVDLNRAPDSASLYAASPTSPVCPDRTFAGEAIYADARAPDAKEVAARVQEFWRPYHAQLATELAEIRSRHGYALLWDAHSIASEVPGLFPGVLPEFNFGTRDGISCPSSVSESLLEVVTRDGRFGAVLDGRFKGGYITLNYGKPAERIHAVQLELAQRAYMDEGARPAWDSRRAQAAAQLIELVMRRFLETQ